ncbi:peptide chain release factor N(5)-glutamine methyltransferase [Polaromonas sp.]|uniref:peptide chain release factor N(5)-glutamine methyltransferase n=1 Tax=Polaromonas sp. TaxID=1869339 RepID=UPI003BAAC76E
MNQPTVRQALQTAQTLGLERLDAQLLLLHALGKPDSDRAWLLAHDDDVLPEAGADLFRQLGLRRAAGEPLAYIVGYKEFFGLRLKVDARVLVPRPDTETLVAWSLDILQAPAMSAKPRVLDLGTGSGAIAIAVAHSLQTSGRPATVVAVDASADALAVAQENAHSLHADIQFLQSHWLEKVSGHFHLIASNPPYIASADPHLAALVHEPLQALAAGSDGLNDIRQIIKQAPEHLHPGGWLLLEHGYDQSDRVRELLAGRGFQQVQSRLDLAGIARCSGGQWLGAC